MFFLCFCFYIFISSLIQTSNKCKRIHSTVTVIIISLRMSKKYKIFLILVNKSVNSTHNSNNKNKINLIARNQKTETGS